METVDTAGRRDALVERLFASTLGAWDLLGVYLGDRLGLYRALADRGPLTGAELAEATGTHERYAREWAEQQATAGILEVDGEGRFLLPAGHDEALLDEGSLNFIAPIAKLVVACTEPLPQLLDAFRSGEGVPYADYGANLHEGQAAFTRPMFEQLLGSEWLPSIPDVHVHLRVRARNRLAGSDVAARVTFHHRDAADPQFAHRYDLVYVHESLHDMSFPVDVLRACRGLLTDGGSVVVGDERVADRFAPPGDDLERFYYGFSLLHCLPVGMVGDGAAGTGAVMRVDTVRRYAEEAGFGRFEVLPIENDFYRFYRLGG